MSISKLVDTYSWGVSLTSSQPSHNPRSCDRAVADGNDILKLRFKDAVEVLGSSHGDEGVGVGESREDSDPAML